MPLPPGSRLGPYEVVAPLGSGGMGEVHLAKDTRLGRDVAIKVLPVDVATDADRLARFEREAKAVSALNHPNIVTLYEVGASDAGPYLVLERVDGQSLRQLIQAGPLAMKKLVDLGAQIAAGLAKAHSAGIVHRDLKPENVMVTADGFAKILDFGLARLVWPDEGLGDAADTATFVKETASGVILGTLGYLSPEQAAGKPADYRADQFAFGALLYEMATGERPFRRASVPESLTATMREEPEPIRSKRPDVPPPLAWLIERCLAKAPDDRYASTKDLARDLADIRDRFSEISRMPDVKPTERRSNTGRSRLMRWSLALGVVSALIAGTFVVARRTMTIPVASYQALTFERGTITGARFSPDGRRVYYSATRGGGQSHIYVTDLDRTESRLLEGLPAGFLLGVSSKNELAILETGARDCCTTTGVLMRVPAIGGTPHPLIDGVRFADWASDGERFALDRQDGCRSVDGRIIAPRCGFIRVSPVNDDIAFKTASGLEIRNAAGTQLATTTIAYVFGLAWSRDGREVWFTGSESASGTDRAIYVLSLDGKRRLVARAPGAMTIYDVTPDGNALVATGANIYGINAGTNGQDERALDLNGRTQIAGLSDDGRSLLLNEDREVGRGAWLRSTDGEHRIQLSEDLARGLSPDGKFALIQKRDKEKEKDSSTRLVLQPTGAGQPRDVIVPTGLRALPGDVPAAWSHDPERLFLPFSRDGRTRAIYRQEADGSWRRTTPEGTGGPFVVSPDGETVAANDEAGVLTLYYVDGRPPRRVEGEHGLPVHWSADGRLLLAVRESFSVRLHHRDLATGRAEPWRTFAPSDPTGITATTQVLTDRDERSYVYLYSRGLNDLFLARNLR